MTEISFLGFKQLAKWLLEARAGKRFLSWFLQRYAREIMSTETGAKFHEWVAERAIPSGDLKAMQASRVVIIETFPDGFIQVYGAKNLRVSFVHRLQVQSVGAELLDEERCWLDLSEEKRKVYLENVIAMDHSGLHPKTVGELLQQRTKSELYGMVGRAGASHISKDGNNRNAVLQQGN